MNLIRSIDHTLARALLLTTARPPRRRQPALRQHLQRPADQANIANPTLQNARGNVVTIRPDVVSCDFNVRSIEINQA